MECQPRLCMPGLVCTRNVRLIIADPLSKSEIHQRDRAAGFCVGKDLAPLAEGVVKSWASPLHKASAVSFELQLIQPPCEQPCGVSGSGNAGGRQASRGGAGLVLCQMHLAAQCVGSSFEGAVWTADGHCVRC